MYQDITQLHEEVLEFLLEKRKEIPDLCFTIRQKDDNEKLTKKNWFYGTNKEIHFSFWDCTYERSEFYIKLIISTDGNLSLKLQANKTQSIEVFFSKLKEQLQENENYRQASITNNKNFTIKYGQWFKGLITFLNTDKLIIDNYLKNYLIKSEIEKVDNKIGFISLSKFEANLAGIEKYRRFIATTNSLEKEYEFNTNLKLKSIHLQNIGHFENLNLDLSKQVTVLIGENGSGKSTVLRAIALGITGTDFFDLDKDLQREKDEIFNGLLKINHYQKGVPQYSQEGSLTLLVNNKELRLNLTPSRIAKTKVEIKEIKANREIILHEGNYLKTLVLGFSQSEAKRVNKNLFVKREAKPSVVDLLPLISNATKDTINDLVEWIYYYVHDRENTNPVDNLFAVFSKIISNNDNNKAVTIKRPYKLEGVLGSPSGEKDIIVCTPDMPDGIHLSLVSQGYKNIFRWVGEIMMKLYVICENFYPKNKDIKDVSGIVLIDEIDTYLHPKWQRNILKVLVEEFPKLQFVVTTHSAGVLSNLNPKIENGVSMYVISKDTCKEYDFNNLNIYSMDITSILTNRNLFNEPEYPEPMNTKIQQYQKLLERLKNNEARTNPTLFIEVENMHNMLLQDLAQEHPVIIRGNMLMNLKRPQ